MTLTTLRPGPRSSYAHDKHVRSCPFVRVRSFASVRSRPFTSVRSRPFVRIRSFASVRICSFASVRSRPFVRVRSFSSVRSRLFASVRSCPFVRVRSFASVRSRPFVRVRSPEKPSQICIYLPHCGYVIHWQNMFRLKAFLGNGHEQTVYFYHDLGRRRSRSRSSSVGVGRGGSAVYDAAEATIINIKHLIFHHSYQILYQRQLKSMHFVSKLVKYVCTLLRMCTINRLSCCYKCILDLVIESYHLSNSCTK